MILDDETILKIWALREEEKMAPSQIARKLKIKTSDVKDILGEAGKDGLGDLVKQFTDKAGISAVVEAVIPDCGCKARAEKLNEVFPLRSLNDLLLEDYEYLDNWFSQDKKSVTADEQKEIVRIYNHVFKSKRKTGNCGPCVANIVKELRKVYLKAKSE